MILIESSYEILTPINGEEILKSIELAGRLCYKSEGSMGDEANHQFIKDRLASRHESIIEHIAISVRFISNRGFTHELIRHRIGSYSQESTRYCNYSKDKFSNQISCIDLVAALELQTKTKNMTGQEKMIIRRAINKAWEDAEVWYFHLLELGTPPELARNVLPIGLKTEIITTFNLREWRHFFKLRTSPAAHPNMRELAIPLLLEFNKLIPVIFEDIAESFIIPLEDV